MASGATSLGHGGFDDRVATIGRTIPWTRAGENVAVNRTVAAVVDRWLKDRGHRSTIEGNFDLTGIGVVNDRNGLLCVTQIFIKAR